MFPWYINVLTEETAEDVAETASLIWFVPSNSKCSARTILEKIGKRYISKCAEMKVNVNLLFFISWKGSDGGRIRDYIKSIAGLPDNDPVLVVFDFPRRKVKSILLYYCRFLGYTV